MPSESDTTYPIYTNGPDVWLKDLPVPGQNDHKYDRGHAVILGAETFTGATRLAAEACSRIGAGLVTVLSDSRADLYRSVLPADIMVREGDLAAVNRPTALLAGPGGLTDRQTELVRAETRLPHTLDADAVQLALTGARSQQLRVLTPHDGEFKRAFPDLTGTRPEKARRAASATSSILVLKGPETVIAAPDGRCVLNTHATPWLAKAGTGDVLAGLICGLVAQGMPAFEAACAGVWIHGEAGRRTGPGLIPQDLIASLPGILRDLLDRRDLS